MGTLNFLLPRNLDSDELRELERACVAGGPDNMPTPTRVQIRGEQLRTQRSNDESGYLVAPWLIPGMGRLMGTTATLMERSAPYHLLVELARGKINQMRCQAADWKAGGLQIPEELNQAIRNASLAFGRSVTSGAPTETSTLAMDALRLGYGAAEQLVNTYIDQVFQIRHQRQPKLDTQLGCRLPAGTSDPSPALTTALKQSCNAVTLPFSWCEIEAEESNYRWARYDALLNWATQQGFAVSAGPLIDFSSIQLPAWLWLWERDVPSLSSFMCKFVEATVRRYRQRIRRWQLTAGSNCATVLGLTEEDLIGLTYRLADAARQVDPSLELVLGISQPWGEYLTVRDYTHSPFIFADNLIRSPLNLSALDLEIVMGVEPRGTYCRDTLEVSRQLDLFALLGLPLRVTVGFPAMDQGDPDADPELRVGASSWKGAYSAERQAEWARTFGRLILCKPYVQCLQWVHLSDAQPHQFPHCGLVDLRQQLRPALQELRQLREQHLK